MKAKEYLSQLGLLDARINNKRQELAGIRILLQNVQGVDYSSPKVQVSLSYDAGERNITRCLKLEQEIEDGIKRFIVLKHKIVGQINSLDNTVFVKILFLRYVEYRKLSEVADIMGYSYQHARRLHGYALQSFTDHNSMFIQDSRESKSGYCNTKKGML
ncbi:MAG: hypothetical protein HFH67_11600 [Lachnospiraceae bacterium]|nr:hypothetical protein [Lachnospiraceae bacterium]